MEVLPHRKLKANYDKSFLKISVLIRRPELISESTLMGMRHLLT